MAQEKLGYFSKENKVWLISILGFLIFFDFFSKSWVHKNLELYESIEILNFINFTFIKNYGIAFSIFNNSSLNLNIFLSALIFFICGFLFYLVFLKIDNEKKNKYQKLVYVFILAGGVGNLLDRLLYGYVVDFIDITFNPYVFNLADSYVTIGLLIYLIFSLKKSFK